MPAVYLFPKRPYGLSVPVLFEIHREQRWDRCIIANTIDVGHQYTIDANVFTQSTAEIVRYFDTLYAKWSTQDQRHNAIKIDCSFDIDPMLIPCNDRVWVEKKHLVPPPPQRLWLFMFRHRPLLTISISTYLSQDEIAQIFAHKPKLRDYILAHYKPPKLQSFEADKDELPKRIVQCRPHFIAARTGKETHVKGFVYHDIGEFFTDGTTTRPFEMQEGTADDVIVVANNDKFALFVPTLTAQIKPIEAHFSHSLKLPIAEYFDTVQSHRIVATRTIGNRLFVLFDNGQLVSYEMNIGIFPNKHHILPEILFPSLSPPKSVRSIEYSIDGTALVCACADNLYSLIIVDKFVDEGWMFFHNHDSECHVFVHPDGRKVIITNTQVILLDTYMSQIIDTMPFDPEFAGTNARCTSIDGYVFRLVDDTLCVLSFDDDKIQIRPAPFVPYCEDILYDSHDKTLWIAYCSGKVHCVPKFDPSIVLH